MKLAAIDIGSNAIRLLFSMVSESEGKLHFHKIALIRMPVRLGSDSFLRGEISTQRKEDLIKTLQAYKNMIEVSQMEDYMACATSALREASNGKEIIQEIKERTGMDVKLIDGKLEANLIFETHIADDLEQDKAYLYIDVGGGSTELTLYSHGEKVNAVSFKIGTIRLLEGLVQEEEWGRLRKWLDDNVMAHTPVTAIGTGGNINKLFKLTRKKEGQPMFLHTLTQQKKILSGYTYEQRINELGMRPDRADVIIPALEIYSRVMHWGKIHEMYVPKVGLVDGMVRMMYEKRVKKGKLRHHLPEHAD